MHGIEICQSGSFGFEKQDAITEVWRSGVWQLEGAWPLSCVQHTPGGRPKISRSGPAREWSVQISGRLDSVGGGAFPKWFSQPPYYLFELFALEGFICLAHLGWLLWPPAFGLGGVYWQRGRRPRRRLIKPTVLWTTIPPWALPWSSPPVGGRLGCGSISGAVPSTDRADQEVTSAGRRTNVVVLRTATRSCLTAPRFWCGLQWLWSTLPCWRGDLAAHLPRRHVRPSQDHPARCSWSLCRHPAASHFAPYVSKHLEGRPWTSTTIL